MSRRGALRLVTGMEFAALALIVAYVWLIATWSDFPEARTVLALIGLWLACWGMVRLDDLRLRLRSDLGRGE